MTAMVISPCCPVQKISTPWVYVADKKHDESNSLTVWEGKHSDEKYIFLHNRLSFYFITFPTFYSFLSVLTLSLSEADIAVSFYNLNNS